MPKLLTFWRLPLLAAALTLSLTSCFDRDKKGDPKPTRCAGKPTPTSTGGNS